MLDGLYIGSDTLTGDYATVLYRIQLLGFNAIRIPFSFQVLFNQETTSYTRPCTTSSKSDIQDNVTPPGVSVPGGASLPPLVRCLDTVVTVAHVYVVCAVDARPRAPATPTVMPELQELTCGPHALSEGFQ